MSDTLDEMREQESERMRENIQQIADDIAYIRKALQRRIDEPFAHSGWCRISVPNGPFTRTGGKSV